MRMLFVCFQVWIEFGRIKLPQGLHPNDLEEEWGKLILEMLEREKALRPAVERYKHNCQMFISANSGWTYSMNCNHVF